MDRSLELKKTLHQSAKALHHRQLLVIIDNSIYSKQHYTRTRWKVIQMSARWFRCQHSDRIWHSLMYLWVRCQEEWKRLFIQTTNSNRRKSTFIKLTVWPIMMMMMMTNHIQVLLCIVKNHIKSLTLNKNSVMFRYIAQVSNTGNALVFSFTLNSRATLDLWAIGQFFNRE